jgi:hypothetical protein
LSSDNKSKKNCKNYDKFFNEILKRENIFVHFIFNEIKFDIDNYQMPLKKQFNNFFSILSNNLNKRDFIYITEKKVIQDDGVIFVSEKNFVEVGVSKKVEKDFFFFDKINSDDEITDITNEFYVMYLMTDSQYNFYSRKYMKFQQLIAELSGFMNLLVMVARSAYFFYYNFRFKAYLFNRLIRIGSKDCGGNDKIDNFVSSKIEDKFNKINNNSVNNKPKNDGLQTIVRKFQIRDNSQMNINNNNLAVVKFKHDNVGCDQSKYSQNLELKLDSGLTSKINRVASKRQDESVRRLNNINDNNNDKVNLKDISYSNISNMSDNKLKKIDEGNEDVLKKV